MVATPAPWGLRGLCAGRGEPPRGMRGSETGAQAGAGGSVALAAWSEQGTGSRGASPPRQRGRGGGQAGTPTTGHLGGGWRILRGGSGMLGPGPAPCQRPASAGTFPLPRHTAWQGRDMGGQCLVISNSPNLSAPSPPASPVSQGSCRGSAEAASRQLPTGCSADETAGPYVYRSGDTA